VVRKLADGAEGVLRSLTRRASVLGDMGSVD
jgi:hypothetical protein